MEIDPSFIKSPMREKRRSYAPLPIEHVKSKKRLLSKPIHTSTPVANKNDNNNDHEAGPELVTSYSENELMQWNGYANKFFKIQSLHPYQAEAIKCFTDKKDLLSIIRTGGGKSLCFQLPSLLQQDQLVLVIAPISALVREQVMKLQEKASTQLC